MQQKTSLRLHKKILLFSFCAASMIAYTNCSGAFKASSPSVINASSSTGAAQLKMNLIVKDASGTTIFDDSDPAANLVLKAGQNYSFIVNYQGTPPADATLALKYTNIGTIGALPQTIPLQFGTNVISGNMMPQGSYALEFDSSTGGVLSSAKSYNAAVSCPSPTFTAASLNANGISAAASGSNNLFDFSVGAVTSSANGLAPYQCAIDPTGTSILDTGFQPCSQVFSKIYSNFVASRKVNVVVRDACNITQSVGKVIALPYSVPALGQANVFISGQTSGATGNAVNDKRVDGVTYLATNKIDHIVVQSALDGTSFTIQSSQNYRQASSVNFGVKITLNGLTNTLNLSTMSGTVDASAARIQSAAYSTDEAGGSQVASSYSGLNCILSNQLAQVKMVAGTPCTTAGGGDQNSAAIEVSGHYKCSALSNSGGSIGIEGDFDGISLKQDSCIGGGGGGGGGVVPISL